MNAKMAAHTDRSDGDSRILQEAFGAVAEWRRRYSSFPASFISMRAKALTVRCVFSSTSRKQEVVDACLRAVLHGKQPTLGHRMLAALGGLLRLDVLLTTNFDELIEQAFAEARNPVTVFDVHLGDVLPARSAVATQRSLIKLHGNRYSLRADYTLDSPPAEPNLLMFLEYLAGSDLPPAMGQSPDFPRRCCRNHLIVMGISAKERRTTEFIRRAWRTFPDFKVFWICHAVDDVLAVQELCKRAENEHGVGWNGAYVLRHTNPGLLFLHIFQHIRHTIPTSGVIFPSTHACHCRHWGIVRNSRIQRLRRKLPLSRRLSLGLTV